MNGNQLLTGAFGIVIVPDNDTQERSRALAAELLEGRAEFVLSPRDLPHLTLYHAKVAGLPSTELVERARRLEDRLGGLRLRLQRLGFAGGNFLFWDVDWNTDREGRLRDAHEEALQLSHYLDRSAPPKATSEEGLQLTPPELSNVEAYGHPLVRDLYRPHITLGFMRGLENSLALPRTEEEWTVQVSEVRAAEIGFPGRVERLL